jgi:hypothetical protein
MIARTFTELFTAGCLEEKEELCQGKIVRLYRAVPDIDIALLGPVERLVVSCLDVFRTFEEFFRLAAEKASKIEEIPGACPSDARLLAEAGEVIDQALEYLPPVCTCSI